MKRALKNFGLGLVYFFLLPIFLAIASLAGVYALIVIVYYTIKGLIRFFKGDKFFKPLPEDIKAAEIKARQLELDAQQNQPEPPAPQPDNRVYIQQNYYQQPQGIPPQATGLAQPSFNPQPNIPPYQQPYSNPVNQQAYQNTGNPQQYQNPVNQQQYQNQINQQPNYYSQIPSSQPQSSQISQNPQQNPSNQLSSSTNETPKEVTNFIDISKDDQGGDDL